MKILDMLSTARLCDAIDHRKWQVRFFCRCGHSDTQYLEWLLKNRRPMTMEGLAPRGKCSVCVKAGLSGEVVEVRLETPPWTVFCRPEFVRVVYLADGREAAPVTGMDPPHHGRVEL